MTVEELEIIVTAKVTEALQELQKFMPAIKETMQKVQEEISKIDTKEMTNKIHQAVNIVKMKLRNLKKSAENNKVTIEVNNKEAEKQISQLEKEIDSLQKKISSRELKLSITNDALDKIRYDANQEVIQDMPDAGAKRTENETKKRLSGNEEYNSLIIQSDKLNNEVMKYNELLNSAKQKLKDLKANTEATATTQNKLGSFFSAIRGKIEQIKPALSKIKTSIASVISALGKGVLGKISSLGQTVNTKIKGMNSGIKQGLGHILKYATTLFSLRGIYSILSQSAQSWLSSQNSSAKQMSSNIEYMKYAMGSAFAPVIEYVINLVYQLMKAIQSVAYAMSGVNIFAKATASSMKSTSGSASKTSKSLAGVHNEINNVSKNDNGGGSGSATPSVDLSSVDEQMTTFSQNLYDFFKPLKESWDNYGTQLIAQIKTTAEQVVGLISSVWKSFENLIINGTVYTSLELILSIIGNIAEAFSNAWTYNGNGDVIVQNLANAFNNLLVAINNVIQSDSFQNWLNNCSDKFRIISEKIAEVNWEPIINGLTIIGEGVGNIALTILEKIVECLAWFGEHPEVTNFLSGLAVAFIAVHTATNVLLPIIEGCTNIFKTLHTIISVVGPIITETLIPAISGISAPVLIVVGVIAGLIATFVHLYNSNEEFRNKVNETWNNIVSLFQNYVMPVIEEVKNFITNILETIWNALKDIWGTIEPFIQEIFENIMDWWNTTGTDIVETLATLMQKFLEFVNKIWTNVISPIVNYLVQTLKPTVGLVMGAISGAVNAVLSVISTVWNTTKGVFNGIIQFITGVFTGNWRKAWEGISNIFSSIANGLKNIFKVPINFIIDCINGFIGGINKIQIPSWVPAVGGRGFNIPKIPRLAKGNVAYDETLAIFGEYSGASTNPEITAPQSVIYETVRRAISDSDTGDNDGREIRVQVYLGTNNFVDEVIDGINEKTRRTGKAQIKVAYV